VGGGKGARVCWSRAARSVGSGKEDGPSGVSLVAMGEGCQNAGGEKEPPRIRKRKKNTRERKGVFGEGRTMRGIEGRKRGGKKMSVGFSRLTNGSRKKEEKAECQHGEGGQKGEAEAVNKNR